MAAGDGTIHQAMKECSGESSGNPLYDQILSLRKKLCDLVEQLSAVPTNEEGQAMADEAIVAKLDPYFALIPPSIDWNGDGADLFFRGITPLVIACDKGNLACLRYFCRFLEREAKCPTNRGIVWEVLIGSPLRSKTLGDETTAFHHCTTELAIRKGHRNGGQGTTFLELLERICIAQELIRGNQIPCDNTNFVLKLGEAVNSHGDTPLMMAVANNISLEGTEGSSAKVFLEHWYTRALKTCNSQELKRALSTKNDLGRSVLSFAWDGGIVDLVQWLVDIDNFDVSPHIVTSEETFRFRENINLLGKKVKMLSVSGAAEPETKNMYEKRFMATEKCTKLLESHLQKRSDDMARKLLEELEGDSTQKTTKRKKKKKRKQQKKGKDSSDLSTGEQSVAILSDESNSANPVSNKEDVSSLTTLANDKVAVKVPEQQQQANTLHLDNAPPVLTSVWHRKRTYSLDETNQLLRDRYKQGSTKVTISSDSAKKKKSTAPTPITPSQSSDADSVLSALCLDVNCLLYSDHGMALNLSPAQLDAVEQILREQLESVAKARILQERRLQQHRDAHRVTKQREQRRKALQKDCAKNTNR